MKKIISSFLAIVMVLGIAVTAIPTSFAVVESTDYFRIGDTGYATLKAALKAVPDGGTIEMLKDFTDNTAPNLGSFSKSFTINGNGHTYTKLNNTNSYIFILIDDADNKNNTVTINNMNWHAASGFYVKQGTLNLNGCTVTTNFRMSIRTGDDLENSVHTTNYYATFNIHDTVLQFEDVNVGEPVVLLNAGKHNILNVTGNSKLIRNNALETWDGSKYVNAAPQNRAIINIGHHADNTEINFGPDTELVLNQRANTDGNSAYCFYQCRGPWDGSAPVRINLSPKATIRVNTTVPETYIYHTEAPKTGTTGYQEITEAGVNYLVKNGCGTVLQIYTSTTNDGSAVYSFQSTSTVVESGYTTYKMVDTTTKQGNFKYISSDTVAWTDDLPTALSGADAGSTIRMYADCTIDFLNKKNNPAITVSKDITFNGNGHNLVLTNTWDTDNKDASVNHQNYYGFNISRDISAHFTNFNTLGFEGGGFIVKDGATLKVSGITNGYATGRPVFRIDNDTAGSITTVEVSQSTLSQIQTANKAETPVVFNPNKGTARMVLNEGATIKKPNGSNDTFSKASNVFYNTGTSKSEIIMNSGSKVVNASASGTTGGILGWTNTGSSLDLTINEGAYLVCDSTVLQNFHFIYTDVESTATTPIPSASDLNIKAHDGAFLVKDGVSHTLRTETSVANGKAYRFEPTTSPVNGYTAYKVGLLSFAIGDAKYTTLQKAVSAATAGQTITLLYDYSGNEHSISVSKNLTIDLNNKNYTTTNHYVTTNGAVDHWYLINEIYADLTIKNGTLNTSGGLVVKENGDLTLLNVTLNNAPNACNWGRPAIKLGGDGKDDDNELASVTFDGTTVNQSVTGEAAILIEHTVTGTVNLKNNSIITNSGYGDGQIINDGVIGVQQETAEGHTSKGTNAIINIEGGSKIVVDKMAHSASIVIPVITDGTTGNITVNLSKDSCISVNRPDDNVVSRSAFIYTTHENGTTVINDEGCIFQANKGALGGGFTLPTLTKSNNTFVGFNINGKMYKGGGTAKITADGVVTLKQVYYTEDDFGMVDGAALRTKGGEGGIRFSSYITDEFVNAMGGNGDNLIMGTYVTPGSTPDIIPSTDINRVHKQSSENFNRNFAGYQGKNVFHVALILEGMKYANSDELVPVEILYQFDIVAQAYFGIKYEGDSEYTYFYTTVTDDNIRNMNEIAATLLERHNAETGEYADFELDIDMYNVVVEITEACK